jgi:iron complex transport system permease protein
VRRAPLLLPALCLALVLVIPLACGLGSVRVAPTEVVRAAAWALGVRALGPPAEASAAIVMQVRLPRVLVAALVGGGLALAGAVMQGLFRNPMASPDVLGVSAGGSLGAVIAIAAGLADASAAALPLLAIAGSLVSALAVYLVATRRGGTSLLFVILAGLAVSSLLNGLISAVLLLAREQEVSRFIFWTMGGLDGRRWSHVVMLLVVALPCSLVLLAAGRELNVLMLGEEGAHALGLSVEPAKRLLLGLAALLTGAAVAASGTIGFVGLLVPHLLRLATGADHRRLLPASAVGGALFLVLCDLVARAAFAPMELRVGIVTALVGSPYLLFLILRYRARGTVEPFR